MRKVILLLVVVALVVGVGSSAAKTVAVTISRDGFVPKSVTIAQGDTVQFTNSDSIVHQIAFRSMSGVTCSGSPLVLQTGFSGSCTFANAGNFSYSDPNTRGQHFSRHRHSHGCARLAQPEREARARHLRRHDHAGRDALAAADRGKR